MRTYGCPHVVAVVVAKLEAPVDESATRCDIQGPGIGRPRGEHQMRVTTADRPLDPRAEPVMHEPTPEAGVLAAHDAFRRRWQRRMFTLRRRARGQARDRRHRKDSLAAPQPGGGGTLICSPLWIRAGFVICGFRACRPALVVPKKVAMPMNVSPDFTV